MNNIIGSVSIISLRTTSEKGQYTSINEAKSKNISIAHVVLILRFTDYKIFNKYIANSHIPYQIKVDPETNTTYYEVYIGFWPNLEGVYALLTAANYSSIHDSFTLSALNPENFKKLLAPLTARATALKESKTLPTNNKPSSASIMILHAEQLEHEFDSEVKDLAALYADQYKDWRELEAQTMLLEHTKDPLLTQYQNITHTYKMRMQMTEEKLKNLMYPHLKLNHDKFMKLFNRFVTYAVIERNVLTLPLLHNLSDKNVVGLGLQPIIEFFKDRLYHTTGVGEDLIGNHCAEIIFNGLWEGARNSPHEMLRKYLVLHWYIERLSLALAPVTSISKDLNNKLADTNSKVNPGDEKPLLFSEQISTDSTNVNNASKMLQRAKSKMYT